MSRTCTAQRALGVLCGVCAVFAVCASAAGAATIESELGYGFMHSAKLEAQIDPQEADTTCQAQYVSNEAFEAGGGREAGWSAATTVPCSPEDLGEGKNTTVGVADIPGGLSLDSVYDYRFLVMSAGKTVYGHLATFTTFGLEEFTFQDLNAEGNPSVQAGGHPYEVSVNFALNANYGPAGKGASDATLKDLGSSLPPGLIGNPTATPRCPQRLEEEEKCPREDQIGTFGAELIGNAENGGVNGFEWRPLYNLVPPKGVAARFGVVVNGGISAYIDASVRSGGDYGITAASYNITSITGPKLIGLKFWGVPADSSHDAERWCTGEERWGCASGATPKAFLRNPTSCVGAAGVGAFMDSYQVPGEYTFAHVELSGFTGCEGVPFAPGLDVGAPSGAADSPTGLSVDVHVPQNDSPSEAASADLKDAVVRFPAGFVIDPSSADGLVGCSEAQAGFTGFQELDRAGEPGVLSAQFTPGAAECPDASKLGSVEVDTPLLEHPLPGALYLAVPHSNPFGSLLAVYLTVYDPVSGVVVKVPGKIEADPVTGQLTTTFKQNPQLPVEDVKVNLFGESRAALTTPSTCGSYAASGVLTPWDGNPGVSVSSAPVKITQGAGGAPCPSSENAMPDSPVFAAGTASPVAGSFSPFVLKLAREDGSQRFSALNVTLPAGLVGRIAGLEECPPTDIEAAGRRDHEGEGAVEARSPSCPAGSEVGVVHVGAGSGAPFYVSGHAYFAGPYAGAPFSLVFVTPVLAGPFDLGTVVVRAGLYIDPLTAQVSVRSDAFPTILDGIPLDIRSIGVDVNRSGFVLNPTSCEVMHVTGQEKSTTGHTAGLSDRFQAGGCTEMPFHPSFTVSTPSQGTRKDGTSVLFKVSYPAGALGHEAWLAGARFEFPKQLAARQKTLEQACTASVFGSNPASCPAGSRIGTASVKTELLSVPLEGPVYLVSYGNAKFPEAVFVLQGDGITIDLHSQTNIENGITSANLPAIPGVPFEEATVTLPAGPYSEFAAEGNMCAKTKTVLVKKKVTVRVKGHKRHRIRTIRKSIPAGQVVMPTVLTGQNGAVIRQKTPVTVTGCATVKHKAKPRHKHHAKKHHRAAGRHSKRAGLHK